MVHAAALRRIPRPKWKPHASTQSCFLLWPILYTGNQDRLENHGNQPNLGGEGGIRTHGTVTRTTVFEFYDSHTGLCRAVVKRVLLFGISEAMMLVCDASCHAVLRSWFANWFANSQVPLGGPPFDQLASRILLISVRQVPQPGSTPNTAGMSPFRRLDRDGGTVGENVRTYKRR
jgi:hypothetical protein